MTSSQTSVLAYWQVRVEEVHEINVDLTVTRERFATAMVSLGIQPKGSVGGRNVYDRKDLDRAYNLAVRSLINEQFPID